MSKITPAHKQIAKHISSALGIEKPSVIEFWDDTQQNSIFILESVDKPEQGISIYSTVGLFNYPLTLQGKQIAVRAELIGACQSVASGFNHVLATLAFCVINSGWGCAPGIIFPDVLVMYELSNTLSDIFFVYPFLWEGKLKSLEVDGYQVAWLLAVPVSKAETEFARKHGAEQLENLFIRENIDIFDLNVNGGAKLSHLALL